MTQFVPTRYVKALCDKYPPLSAEEEANLFASYKSGDQKAGNKIILHHSRLAQRLASKYAKRVGSFEEAFSEASLGIAKALPKFDTERGCRFATAAQYFAVTELLEHIAHNATPVVLPRSRGEVNAVVSHLRKINDVADITDERGQDVVRYISKKIGIKDSHVRAILGAMRPGYSLDGDNTDRGVSFLDGVTSQKFNQEDALLQQEEIQVLKKVTQGVLAGAKPRDRMIFEKLYLSSEPHRVQDIGKEAGITPNWVQRINRQILGQIRAGVRQALDEAAKAEAVPSARPQQAMQFSP
jgi:RNA polymerase sigma-32 factor